MLVYNTLVRRKQTFKPLSDREVGVYTCGPTVYWFAHIGNMKSYVSEDVIKRTLMHSGYKVKHVMNITDVGHLVGDANIGEDKVKMEARKEHKSALDVSRFYTHAFIEDMERLNIIKPDVICKATDHIPEMLALVKKLDEKGYLYKVETGMYYDTSKFKDYGALAGMDFEKLNKYLKAGARVERAAGIRNTTDFAVWRFSNSEEKEMVWDSEWGRGFPGWHIECSAMSMKYLGNHFDIHMGGIDHIPVHHTNEIAQSEGATGEKFVNHWMHMAFLKVDGKKMAKSLGNVYTIKELVEKGFDPIAVRLLFISGHYRQELNFTIESLKGMTNTLSMLYSFIDRMNGVLKSGGGSKDKAFMEFVDKSRKGFFSAMEDDFSTPEALASMYSLVRESNKRAESGMGAEEARHVIDVMLEFDSILGLEFDKRLSRTDKLSEEVEKLIKERNEARKHKDFAEADRIRRVLKEKGVTLEDTAHGTVWKSSD